ncbi:hypothetical protein [Prosthecobacter sp.]|uniref:hypothetical protein n=1 Tax=Prosthecobacter sp. TaxID=1965333 RepID=UPI00378517DA
MKTFLTRSAPVLWMFLVLGFAGPALADNAQAILGRWEFLEARRGSTIFKTAGGEKNLVMDFRQDGTFSEGARSGTFRLLTDSVLRLTYLEKGKAPDSREYLIRIAGDTLTTKNKDRAKFEPESKFVREK